jgi:phage gp29-like protein
MGFTDSVRSLFGFGAEPRGVALPPSQELPRLGSGGGGPVAGMIIDSAKALARSRFVLPGDDKDPALYAAALREAETGNTRRLYGFYESARARDSRLGRVCATRNAAISGRDFTIEPAHQTDMDRQIAASIDEMLREVPNFQSILAELNDSQLTGLSVAEHHWKVDSKERFTSHPIVHQTSLFDWDGYAPAISDGTTRTRLSEYPAHKFLVCSPTSGFPTAPCRRGALQAAIPMSLFKRHVITWWASALERYGQPQLVGTVPAGASEALKAEVTRLIAGLSSQGGATFSEGINIAAITGAQVDPELHLKALDFANKEIAIAILAQNLTTEIMQGSHAAASIARLVQIDVQLSDIQQLEQSLIYQWIKWLVQFNWPGADLPFFRFAMSTPEPFSLEEYSKGLCTEEEFRTARGYGPKELPKEDGVKPEAAKEPLNGAQAQAVLALIESVSARKLPRDSAGREFVAAVAA